MTNSPTFFATLFLIAALMAAVVGIFWLRRERSALGVWGGVLATALCTDLASYALLLLSPALPAAQGWIRIHLLAAIGLFIAWLFFVLVVSGRARWLAPIPVILICALPALTASLVLAHGALNPMAIIQDQAVLGPLAALDQNLGLIGRLIIAYMAGIGVVTTGLLLPMLFSANSFHRPLIGSMLAAMLVVTAGGLLQAAGINPLAPVSNLQLALALNSMLVLVIVLALRSVGVMPVARAAVLDQIQDGVLVLDRYDRLVDLNPAAGNILGRSRRSAVGRPLAEFWPEGSAGPGGRAEPGLGGEEYALVVDGRTLTFDVKTSPVLDVNGASVGRTIVLRDITGRERTEQSLREQAHNLARTNRLVTALSIVAARLGSASDPEVVLETLGAETRKLGLDCAVVTIDPAGEAATLKHVSFSPKLVQAVESITGITVKNYVIPKRFWPGDRILKEKAPVWYPNPQDIVRRMFPLIPAAGAHQAFQALGLQAAGQICILPLLMGDQVIGALPIWGADLQPADGPALAVFASQVAASLQGALAYEQEARRADELARSNAMIVAMSKVAARLDSTVDFGTVVATFGQELKDMGMDCLVGTFDDNQQTLAVRFVSVKPAVIRWAEKVSGHALTELTIPRRLWPTDKVVTEKTPYWDPNNMKGTLNMFPILPERIQRTALHMAGINLDDPVCYLPLATEAEVIGVLAVWGAALIREDLPALTVFASQLTTALKNSQLYKTEARRARELAILLEASEATVSASQPGDVLLLLASQLLGISGFQSCYISEWVQATNTIHGRLDHSRVFWRKEKREAYALRDYPRTRQVLLTGHPAILQGDFEAEEKRWMTELGRTGVILLALPAEGQIVGLLEVATTKPTKLFDPRVLPACAELVAAAAGWLRGPVSAVDPDKLFQLEEALLKVTGAEVCSVSEWDRAADAILTVAVAADVVWEPGEGPGHQLEQASAWQAALEQGVASTYMGSAAEGALPAATASPGALQAETTIIYPLQIGTERIGFVELYDFNHKTPVTPDQIAFLRTVADKASYSIKHAYLLQQTQRRLDEKTTLLAEKETLLKEIHHRVKNNLQIISSLLSLQSRAVNDPRVLEVLRDSQNRVKSMALVHEKLYRSPNLARIDFADYVSGLTTQLVRTYASGARAVTLKLSVEQIWLEVDAAIPCGLIINELVSNALKHAFPPGSAGEVEVGLSAGAEGRISLWVSDDGVGFPAEFDYRNSPSLGLKLVTSLVEQIDGTLTLEGRPGTTFRIAFKPGAHAGQS